MSADQLIQAKLHRLQELRKYQAYYGPNTPYPVIVEINDLEIELRQLLSPSQTQANNPAKKKEQAKKKKQPVPVWQFWNMSRATFDAVITIAFIGFIFLLGSIILVAYLNTQPSQVNIPGCGRKRWTGPRSNFNAQPLPPPSTRR